MFIYKQSICNYLAKHILFDHWENYYPLNGGKHLGPFHWFIPTALSSSPYSAPPPSRLAQAPATAGLTNHWPPSQGADELHESWCTHPWPTQSPKPHWHAMCNITYLTTLVAPSWTFLFLACPVTNQLTHAVGRMKVVSTWASNKQSNR